MTRSPGKPCSQISGVCGRARSDDDHLSTERAGLGLQGFETLFDERRSDFRRNHDRYFSGCIVQRRSHCQQTSQKGESQGASATQRAAVRPFPVALGSTP